MLYGAKPAGTANSVITGAARAGWINIKLHPTVMARASRYSVGCHLIVPGRNCALSMVCSIYIFIVAQEY
jgi:hypothetical protein